MWPIKTTLFDPYDGIPTKTRTVTTQYSRSHDLPKGIRPVIAMETLSQSTLEGSEQCRNRMSNTSSQRAARPSGYPAVNPVSILDWYKELTCTGLPAAMASIWLLSVTVGTFLWLMTRLPPRLPRTSKVHYCVLVITAYVAIFISFIGAYGQVKSWETIWAPPLAVVVGFLQIWLCRWIPITPSWLYSSSASHQIGMPNVWIDAAMLYAAYLLADRCMYAAWCVISDRDSVPVYDRVIMREIWRA